MTNMLPIKRFNKIITKSTVSLSEIGLEDISEDDIIQIPKVGSIYIVKNMLMMVKTIEYDDKTGTIIINLAPNNTLTYQEFYRGQKK